MVGWTLRDRFLKVGENHRGSLKVLYSLRRADLEMVFLMTNAAIKIPDFWSIIGIALWLLDSIMGTPYSIMTALADCTIVDTTLTGLSASD